MKDRQILSSHHQNLNFVESHDFPFHIMIVLIEQSPVISLLSSLDVVTFSVCCFCSNGIILKDRRFNIL